MRDATGERWKRLCQQAAVEQDPEKLLELTQEISRLLDEKQQRLKNARLPIDGSISEKSDRLPSKGSDVTL